MQWTGEGACDLGVYIHKLGFILEAIPRTKLVDLQSVQSSDLEPRRESKGHLIRNNVGGSGGKDRRTGVRGGRGCIGTKRGMFRGVGQV